ncbi:purine permease [Mycolicibacillus parakoreensis]|uniref:Purine permease n=1 Tax=Mycolicibacillus parakoreensis TaxID=1069221 RepID=A0ABY3U8Z2_9MYCO|nr:nucleobase:cation symporter-2 family protein [Mycolicibacillus parakoreensis]MCV7317480.1 purine permease [Mycolicibacillus parakoreensis]ULN54197.1 purine permease [Mycolicibacillus parakoreensis]
MNDRPDAVAAHPENQRLPAGRSLAYGLQHILTMYGGLIAPPIIVGGAAGLTDADVALLISASIFLSGLATVLQSLGVPYFGAKLPIVQGISFAAVPTMATIASTEGLRPIFGAMLVAGIVGVGVAPLFARVIVLFPPVVTGSIITVIGLSLLPVAVDWIVGDDPHPDGSGSPRDIALAGLTVAVIVVASRLFRGVLARLAVLLGLVVGTLVAVAVGAGTFAAVGDGPLIAAPPLLHFGAPTFELGAIVAMLIVMVVILTETTADLLAVGEIIGTPVDSRRLADGLRADMASSTVAAVVGSFPCSAFGQNVGLVALTRVSSRYVVAWGGGILVLLGVLPVVGRVVAAIPLPVLGGAGIVLFGSLVSAGIKTLGSVRFDANLNLVLVAVTVGVGMVPIAAPGFWGRFPSGVQVVLNSGISAAALVAVTLNIFFNIWRRTPERTAR